MKKLYSLMFIIVLMLTFGFISDIEAISLPDSTGKITVTRQVTDVHNPVTNTFTYTLTAEQGNPATISGLPKTFTITFNNVSPTIPSGEWYGTATKTGTLDLTGLNFTEPGDYTFKLIEKSSEHSYYPTDSNTYTITIAVRNVLDADDRPTGDLTIALANIKQYNVKKQNIVFSYGHYQNSVTIGKEVHGNTANLNEYFKVYVSFNSCPTGHEYLIFYYGDLTVTDNVPRTISYNGSSINRLPNGNSTDGYYGIYKCSSSDSKYIYLKHGEYAKIEDVPTGGTYSFQEQGATNYSTYINGSSTNSKQSGTNTVNSPLTWNETNCPTTNCIEVNSNKIDKEYKMQNLSLRQSFAAGDDCPVIFDGCDGENAIVNVASKTVPTGSFIKYLPYTILVLVVLAGLTLFTIANRKNKKYEAIE